MSSLPARTEPTMRQRVSAAEWETRVQLAACYRLIHKFGMTDLIYNHITARSPEADDQFLINPYGLDYSEITASSFYKIDIDGEVITKPDNDYGLNRAGVVIHSAVHAARHDATCVIHTHTRAGVAVSAMRCGLLPLSQSAMRFLGRVGYHDYEGPATSLGERERLAENLGQGDALILRNHGLLVCGNSIPSAFHLTQRLEVACQVQVDAMAATTDLVLPSPEVQALSAEMMAPRSTTNAIPNGGAIEWAALVRQLDRDDTSYRD